ncbi:MAG: hypothetical protein K2X48_17230 [Chitinophagaceae bacterium]|nr:hypothetical protein [Chitinophagaceae bacterium]
MKTKFAIALFLFSAQFLYAQHSDTVLAGYISNLRNLYTLNPNEKAFTHTDKQFYQAGEAIWFRTCLQLYGKPSSLSNVFYTDVTAADGKLLLKNMWHATDSISGGSIYLPDTLSTGIYRLRTYTLWMLNEPSSIHEIYFFVQGRKEQAKTYTTAASEIVLKVFPEGGQLIEGATNRLAFSCYYKNGLPVSKLVSFELTDAGNNAISAPYYFKNGIGYFQLEPSAGKKYTLRVKDENTVTAAILPDAVRNAVSLKVSTISSSKILAELVADDAFYNSNKILTLMAQQNGQVVFLNKLIPEDQKAALIQKKNLVTGFMQVMILNDALQLLSDRWVWVDKTNTDQVLSLEQIRFSPSPKSRNSFELNFKGADTPRLSISVIPADLPFPSFVIPNTFSASSVSTSDHNIPAPIFYPAAEVPDSAKFNYMDAMLLTIQPQRFSWKQVADNKQPPLNYFFETGISVRGYVKKDKERMEFDSSRVEIITKGEDSTTIMSFAKPDSRGAFAVNDLGFMKRATLFMQATTKEKKKRQVEFELLPSYIDTLKKVSTPFAVNPKLIEDKNTSAVQQVFLKNYSVPGIGKELGEIVVTGKAKPSKEDSLSRIYATDLFTNSDFTKIPDDKYGYTSVWQMLQELIPGLIITTFGSADNMAAGSSSSEVPNINQPIGNMSNGAPVVSFNRYTLSNDRVSSASGGSAAGSPVPVAFFLNEIPIDAVEVSSINPFDVVLVKANRNPNTIIGSFANAAGAEGSIMIYTKKFAISKFKFEPNTLTGYSLSSKFFSPDYSKKQQQEMEDRRTTLLWQPVVKFDQNGKATIQFYNNSYTQKFKVIIQGFDNNGTPYYSEKIIE